MLIFIERGPPIYARFKTDISQGYLSDLESGRRIGTSETVAKLA